MGNRPRSQLLQELVKLYGPLGMTRLASRAVLSRMLGYLPLGRGAKHYYSLNQLGKAYNVECQSIDNPNSPEFIQSVKERGCDLIVSVACPYILKKQLLSLPRLGCINIHHAPLPRYKGMMPTFWQMYLGEKHVGVTIHSMD